MWACFRLSYWFGLDVVVVLSFFNPQNAVLREVQDVCRHNYFTRAPVVTVSFMLAAESAFSGSIGVIDKRTLYCLALLCGVAAISF